MADLINIGKASIILSQTKFEYTGTPQIPEVTVTLDGVTLIESVDYVLEFFDNTEIGMARVIVTGIGDYIGRKTKYYEISAISIIEKVELVWDAEAEICIYTGRAFEPEFKLYYQGEELEEGVDFSKKYSNNINAGNRAKVTIEGQGRFVDELSQYFTIWPRDINEVEFVFDGEYVYTGREILPKYYLIHETVPLAGQVDFTVEFENNIDAGIAAMTVIGMGNYTSSFTYEFEIKPADLANTNISIYRPQYTGKPIIPEVVIVYENLVLILDKDYTLEASNNIDAGTEVATLVITGIGNFEGEISTVFDILPRSLLDQNMVFEIESPLSFTGLAQIPNVELKFEDYVLVLNTDFTVVGKDNVNASPKAKLIFTGTGNFCDTIEKFFTIEPSDIEGFTMSLEQETFVFSGLEREPKAMIYFNGEQYLDFDVEYQNNIDVTNNAVAIATVKGNYAGTIEKTFSIVQASINSCTVEIPQYPFENRNINAKPIIKLGTYVLSEGKEYSIEKIENNFNVGLGAGILTYKIITNNFVENGSTFSKAFDIIEENISKCSITFTDTEIIYTGKPVTPNFKLYLNGNVIDENNYTYSFDNNIDASGSAIVTLIGRNNLKNSAIQLFSIGQAPLNSVTCSIVMQTYQDAEKEGLYNLDTMEIYYLGDMLLTPGKDYTVLRDSEDVLTEEVVKTTITIYGANNFTGMHQDTFPTAHLSIGAGLISKIEKKPGYTYIQYSENMEPLFSISTQGKSAIDELNTQLYNHGYVNESVSINSIPIYYLKPNSIVYIKDEATGINGEYVVSKINIPLGNNGTMSLTATKAGKRIY